MKKSILFLGLLCLIVVACSSNDEPNDIGCYEFHHSIRYRSLDSEWESYYDTICNISESAAEKYRAENDVNDSEWICNCTKRRITSPHTHKK